VKLPVKKLLLTKTADNSQEISQQLIGWLPGIYNQLPRLEKDMGQIAQLPVGP